jgi:hypothetical protein
MRIRVKDTEIEIFNGARVKDALLKYSVPQYWDVVNGKKIVTDKFSNPVDLQGELSDAQQLYLTDVSES